MALSPPQAPTPTAHPQAARLTTAPLPAAPTAEHIGRRWRVGLAAALALRVAAPELGVVAHRGRDVA